MTFLAKKDSWIILYVLQIYFIDALDGFQIIVLLKCLSTLIFFSDFGTLFFEDFWVLS